MAVKHEHQELLKDIEPKYLDADKAPTQVSVTVEGTPAHRRGTSLSRYQTSRDDWKPGVRERSKSLVDALT